MCSLEMPMVSKRWRCSSMGGGGGAGEAAKKKAAAESQHHLAASHLLSLMRYKYMYIIYIYNVIKM
jgi:hypothetical protein